MNGVLRAYGPAVLTLLAGLFVTVLFYQLLRVRDEQSATYEFAEQAKMYIGAIEKVIDADINAVRWSAATLAIPVAPDQGPYNRHLKAFPKNPSETLTLFWAPSVTSQERGVLERQARGLYPDFAIQSQASDEDSYPVFAMDSPDRRVDLLGYDFASDPELSKYLGFARETGKTFVVANSSRMKEMIGPTDVVVVSPVRAYEEDTPVSENDVGRFAGFSIGSFRLDDVVDAALAQMNQELVDLQIFDSIAPAGSALLYDRTAESPFTENEILTLGRMNYTGALELASTRRWLVVCTPTREYLSEAYTWQPLLGLFAGLCLTAVVFEHFLAQIRQRRKAEALVLRRTSELRRTNERLSTEIAARRQFEAEREELLELLEQSNESLQQLNRRLAISNNDLQDFAVIASHDLKEPLRKVRVLAENLRTMLGDNSQERAGEYLDLIDSCSSRMQRLITNILQVSRVTTHGNPFTRVDLTQVAQDVVDDLAVRIQETGGTIEIESLPVIEADPLQMRQLMQNLIDNGLKYGRNEETPKVRVYSNGSGLTEQQIGRCEIHVQDDGPGIDSSDADRIFALFQRVNGSGTEEGSGVGLAVCRKIAERHGGSIKVERAAERGARFTVVLPIAQKMNLQDTGSGDVSTVPPVVT